MVMKILLIDDDPRVLRGMARHLRQHGNTVYESTGWTPGIPALLGSLDVVVTDWNMPGANGLDILKECKRLAPDLPVIIFTAADLRESISEAAEAGAHCWVVKPNTDQLLVDLWFLKAAQEHARKVA